MSTVEGKKNLWYKASHGFAPPGTVVGGQDSTGEPIYVARASHEKDMIPGKLVASHGCAFISWNGEEIRKTEYEVGKKNLWYKASHGFAPPGTVVGGQDSTGEPIYVARASHEKDMIPGKLVASHGCAFISWNGEEIRKTEYEVLVGNSNNWIVTSGQNIPSKAFPGGQVYGVEKLFIGRVRHEGSITIGKVQKTHGVCYIPYGGKELRFTEYEVLTE